MTTKRVAPQCTTQCAVTRTVDTNVQCVRCAHRVHQIGYPVCMRCESDLNKLLEDQEHVRNA